MHTKIIETEDGPFFRLHYESEQKADGSWVTRLHVTPSQTMIPIPTINAIGDSKEAAKAVAKAEFRSWKRREGY
jgi:hypothetical protein